ncbi:MAG: hypothetical protein HZB26_04520 [Candidatus Hydrogenedentes bacterium]|nr:hypothetical protein [Candidatus Hydrogenedentota bacterium]
MTISADSKCPETRSGYDLIVLVFLLSFFAILLVRTGWLNDDAYITFRTVDNFLHGYGLRWNVAERVQTYTNPLWMLTLSLVSLVTGEIPLTALFLSMAISLAAMTHFALRNARNYANAALGVTILSFSKAYVEYSTSGLENALTHLLLLLFLARYLAPAEGPGERFSACRMFGLCFLAALASVNRMDAGLLVAPALLYAFFQSRPTASKFVCAAVGFLPLLSWLIFSTIYYGFPFPNTAYAKFCTAVRPSDLLWQGFCYYLNSFSLDPLTLFIILAVMTITIARHWRNPQFLAVMIGVALYLAYILKIGGDFMSGRFFAAPLLVSVVLLSQWDLSVTRQILPLGALTILLGLAGTGPNVFSNQKAEPGEDGLNFIQDERRCYYAERGLLRFLRANAGDRRSIDRTIDYNRESKTILVGHNAGLEPFTTGPSIHFVDTLGLGDPLLSRLPAKRDWYIGHFIRELPEGYQDSIFGQNVIEDPSLAEYWNYLHRVTSKPLWDEWRLEDIYKFNTGQYDHLVREYNMRTYNVEEYVPMATREEALSWRAQPNIPFNSEYGVGIDVSVISSLPAPLIIASLGGGESYSIMYFSKGELVKKETIDLTMELRGQMALTAFQFPRNLDDPVDLIRVAPYSALGEQSVGLFLVVGSIPAVPYSAISAPRAAGAPWDATENIILASGDPCKLTALTVDLGEPRSNVSLEIMADHDDKYLVLFLSNSGRIVGRAFAPPNPTGAGGLSARTLDVPYSAFHERYTQLIVCPIPVDVSCSIGHIRLLGS